MTTREVSLSLYVVERERDRLEKRRAEIMAELAARVMAHKSEQPSTLVHKLTDEVVAS